LYQKREAPTITTHVSEWFEIPSIPSSPAVDPTSVAASTATTELFIFFHMINLFLRV
jgi:hypothetical protein